MSGLGHTSVQTLLASGNVVYAAAGGSAAANATELERTLVARLGHQVKVIVLDASEVGRIVHDNPLLHVAGEPSRLFVAIPCDTETLQRFESMIVKTWTPEQIALGTRAAYLWCPAGASNSPLSVAVGRELGDDVTTRNWATVLKIRDRLASAS